MLCTGCGNEIDASAECPICADSQRRRKHADVAELATTLCTRCGNTVYGSDPCGICSSDRAPKKKTRDTLCVACGNTMIAGKACTVCSSGLGAKRKKRARPEGVSVCLNCDEALERQDWDGVDVNVCQSCQAMLFPCGALERVLNKLRETTEKMDYREVAKEFAGRYLESSSNKTMRYRACPSCEQMMSRRNYGTRSGVIIEECSDHGHWMDERAFGELSVWISRGGDVLTNDRIRRR